MLSSIPTTSNWIHITIIDSKWNERYIHRLQGVFQFINSRAAEIENPRRDVGITVRYPVLHIVRNGSSSPVIARKLNTITSMVSPIPTFVRTGCRTVCRGLYCSLRLRRWLSRRSLSSRQYCQGLKIKQARQKHSPSRWFVVFMPVLV